MGIFYTFVLSLLLASCSSQKEPQKKQIFSAPTFTVFNPEILADIDFRHIEGTNPQQISDHIRAFPMDDYQVVGIDSLTGKKYFCIDSVPDHIKSELRSGRPWETHLEPYMLKYCKPGSIAIDIGSNIGTHAVTMSRCVGDGGKVFSFEPQPKTFRELVVNMALNHAENITFFWGALGSQFREIELNALDPENEGGASLGVKSRGEFVKMIPLDSLNLSNVSFIKIDVEGMEEEVLNGARETILRNKPIMLIEIVGGCRPETASLEVRNEIKRRIKIVEDLGYVMIRLCDLWDYLAIPKNSKEFKEISKTKTYRHHIKKLKKWDF